MPEKPDHRARERDDDARRNMVEAVREGLADHDQRAEEDAGAKPEDAGAERGGEADRRTDAAAREAARRADR
jgi:hypothetical protein